MPDNSTQSYKNHVRWDPLFHFFLLPIAYITVLLTAYNMYRRFTLLDAWLFVFCVAFAVALVKTRTYALRVQDRVIRLEEQHRLAKLLPEPLRSRVSELTPSQLVALRFAPDAELPSLVEQTLVNQWTNKQIKQNIQNWRPDHFRV
jgi:hypothetical protein